MPESSSTTLLGVIADDFTGATDIANTLVHQGMRVTQVIGVPESETRVGDAEAVVVALKSRTAPVEEAVAESLAALRWLRGQGARQFVLKYCSTFDSTAEGNIGPVADALLEELGEQIAVICPAFPANGRTIYQGHLFVGDALLSESSMKDHPLTPMRDANLLRLMEAQSRYETGLVSLQQVYAGPQAIAEGLAELATAGKRYAVVDAISDDDLITIGTALADHALVTGGSGIAMGLPGNFRHQGLLGDPVEPIYPQNSGRSLVLAGSCSQATRRQIAQVRECWPNRRIDVDAIAAGEPVVEELVEWAMAQPADLPVLIYASADPSEVAALQARYGAAEAGEMVEGVISRVARKLVECGFDRLVVAGGETSGAVVSALGVQALRIGPEIDPGVPWTESLGGTRIALALKSGNFGGTDFFSRAFEVLHE